eukprot:gene22101-1291_t
MGIRVRRPVPYMYCRANYRVGLMKRKHGLKRSNRPQFDYRLFVVIQTPHFRRVNIKAMISCRLTTKVLTTDLSRFGPLWTMLIPRTMFKKINDVLQSFTVLKEDAKSLRLECNRFKLPKLQGQLQEIERISNEVTELELKGAKVHNLTQIRQYIIKIGSEISTIEWNETDPAEKNYTEDIFKCIGSSLKGVEVFNELTKDMEIDSDAEHLQELANKLSQGKTWTVSSDDSPHQLEDIVLYQTQHLCKVCGFHALVISQEIEKYLRDVVDLCTHLFAVKVPMSPKDFSTIPKIVVALRNKTARLGFWQVTAALRHAKSLILECEGKLGILDEGTGGRIDNIRAMVHILLKQMKDLCSKFPKTSRLYKLWLADFVQQKERMIEELKEKGFKELKKTIHGLKGSALVARLPTLLPELLEIEETVKQRAPRHARVMAIFESILEQIGPFNEWVVEHQKGIDWDLESFVPGLRSADSEMVGSEMGGF